MDCVASFRFLMAIVTMLLQVVLVQLVISEPASSRPPKWRPTRRPSNPRTSRDRGSASSPSQRQGEAPLDTSRQEFALEAMIEMLKLAESKRSDTQDQGGHEETEPKDDEMTILRDQLILQYLKKKSQAGES